MEICGGGGRGDEEGGGQSRGLLPVAGWRALWGGVRVVRLAVGMRTRSRACAKPYWRGGLVTDGGIQRPVEVCVASV